MFMFAQHPLHPSQLFYKSSYSLAFVNIKPVVPGHVLVIPKRRVRRFYELTKDELFDFSLSCQRVAKALEEYYGVRSMSLVIQDGVDAGQTVDHLHMHIMPRRPNDFKKNDDLYVELERIDADNREQRSESMEKEAMEYRPLFEEGGLLAWYDDLIVRRPYPAQILVNGPLWGIGDLTCQKLEGVEKIDWMRTARFAIYGYVIAGPLYAWWYGYIEKRWTHLKLNGYLYRYMAAKIIYDQLLFEPPYLLQFFTTMGLMQGHELSEIKSAIKKSYLTTFCADTAIWPAIQAINFAFVPVRFQALYVNVISMGWAGFLSWVVN
ncbi:uncharacterized protein LOC126332781 isoform X2 [Schistocerca gregaria]|uniref:uncharacterized protein LOC126332781 isoform X2 n=1 Tax=Schistocerca gregaria TaxID=7010 RepID=UPI00211E74DE|nr:uncharacterized protein LOC126332781 isoform X2 [Schistocerca gregaria]